MSQTYRFLLAMVGLALLTSLGTLSYVLAEDWTFFDALYMTIITLSTVGYGEVRELSTTGRVVSIALIVTGVGSAFYLLAILAEAVVEGRLRDFFRGRSMERDIERLEGHLVVCGFGRFGQVVVEELAGSNLPVVVIESDPAKMALLESKDLTFLIGTAASDATLERAGIRHASAIVITTSSESVNVFITLAARELNPNIRIHARGETDVSVRRLKRAGADHVTSPYHMGGIRTAASVLRPAVVDFLELSHPGHGAEIDLEEVQVEAGSALVGRDIGGVEEETARLRVVAIKRGDESVHIVPEGSARVAEGDHLVVIGERDNLSQLAKLAQPPGA